MTGRQILIRSVLTLALPVTVGGVFFGRLGNEICGGVWFAWQGAKIEFRNYLRQMQRCDY